MRTKISTIPNTSSAISAMNETRHSHDRSRRVAYPAAPNPAMNSAVAPPACHRTCGLVSA